MASIYSLPYELLHIINEGLKDNGSSNLARTCRFLYAAINPILYSRIKDGSKLLLWAVEKRLPGTLEKLLLGGADPNKPHSGQRILEPELLRPTHQRQACFHSISHAHALQDYSMQLMLLDQARMARRPATEAYTRHTVLHLAAKTGQDWAVNMLLDHGAEINSMSRRFCTGSCQCQFMPPVPGQRNLGASPQAQLIEAGPVWTPLHLAICHHHLSTSKLLLSRGASFQVCGWEGGDYVPKVTALHSSSGSGDLAAIDMMLAHYQPDINIWDGSERAPLMWAYRRGQIEAMRHLLRNGADVETAGASGRSLLVHSCATGYFDEAICLLEHGADACSKESEHQVTALHYICGMGYSHSDQSVTPMAVSRYLDERLVVARALLQAGADANAKESQFGQVPLVSAAKGCHVGLVQLLLDRGANINAHGQGDETALVAACRPHSYVRVEDMKVVVQLLLDRGASVHEKPWFLGTALDALGTFQPLQLQKTTFRTMLAGMVRMLMEHGHNPDATSATSESPMARFFLQGHLACCKILADHGAKTPSPTDLRKMITYAVKWNDVGPMQFLLSLEGTSKVMATPARLFSALKSGADHVVEMLLDNGAPHAHVSKDGLTCLHHACGRHPLGINFHKKLLDAGANPNATTNKGLTPLKIAIKHGRLPLVQLLLERGADPDLTGPDESSPMMLASELGHIDILEALLCVSREAPRERWQHLIKLKSAGTDIDWQGVDQHPGPSPGNQAINVRQDEIECEASVPATPWVLKMAACEHVFLGQVPVLQQQPLDRSDT
ncbi:putative Ankyrin repeat-containing domain protein [Seiridium cardinale]